MGEKVIEVTDENFEQEVIQSDIPVLVDFWADWCGPCKIFKPVIEKIAKEYEGKLKVCEVDTTISRNIGINYKIKALPSLLIFKDGEVKNKSVGLKSKADIIKNIEEVIGEE
ncbi:hypothetical protein LCGC14_2287060 [marine sediment metagenome]|uniref:Thioredoxin domain-containing protein n=1 Tax=marine sediment metagenome TaxID=412755 RepID=A0A0F9FMM5_9ZZZZ